MNDDVLWTHLHLMLEDELIVLRESGISWLNVANGLVVRYQDSTPSDAIRIPTRSVVQKVVTEYRRLVAEGTTS